MDWKTTSTLLAQLEDFDQGTAWDLFLGHFRGPVVRFAQRMGLSETEAQDVAQETWIAFAQAFREGSYDPRKGRLKNWLFGIAQRRALNVRRRVHGARVKCEADLETSADYGRLSEVEEASVGDWWEEEWTRAVYENALRRVQEVFSPATWQVFQLLVFEERPVEEVSRTLSMDRAQIYDAKYRVTKKLTELIAEAEEA